MNVVGVILEYGLFMFPFVTFVHRWTGHFFESKTKT
jgi:hypothetical protein